MDYKKCYLYGLKSKKKLLELLHIDRKVYCKSSFLNCKICPYIATNELNKKRLVEAPEEDVKNIQTIILKTLQKLEFPSYVYSGVKKKCYVDNARAHCLKKYLFKLDISKFFPNTTRDKVYKFYLNKLKTSPDVANILTNFATVDLDLKNQYDKSMIKVNKFITEKTIKSRNHLITGSPISTILSYLVNIDMFDKLYAYSLSNNITMTVYVDDVVFSSIKKIPYFFRKEILNIIIKNGYDISMKKCRWYNTPEIKKVTGVILNKDGEMQVPNKLMQKTHNYIEEIKKENYEVIDKLRGCMVATNSINGKLKEYRGQLKSISKKHKKNINK